jgi:oligopeptide/dipeptide ABC transporter ATP-binding protein
MNNVSDKKVVMRVESLKKYFPLKRTLLDSVARKPLKLLKAVDDVSFYIRQGETVSLVGESGCGKSTLARTILRLYDPDEGKIYFGDEDITELKGKQLRKHRTYFQMIFQDPYSSLNPRKTVRETLEEVIRVHNEKPVYDHSGIENRIFDLLDQVGLSRNAVDRTPGEFSGGQRQRIGIARALAVNPSFIIADEPVSALDVSIQAQVLNLLIDIQVQKDLAFLFITHDLRVVRLISHRVAVMYLGKIIELSPTNELYNSPHHPYTDVLIRAAPVLDAKDRNRDYVIEGDPPSPVDLPAGCRFNPRCRYAADRCRSEEPSLREIGDGRFVACHYPLNAQA